MTKQELDALIKRVIDECISAGELRSSLNDCICLYEDDEHEDTTPYAMVYFDIEVDGYIEDDARCGGYMTGTGAYIVTDISISVDVEIYDENDNKVDINISAIRDEIEKYV